MAAQASRPMMAEAVFLALFVGEIGKSA